MTLQWLAGFAIDSNHNTIWIAWDIDANLDLDFAQLFLDLLLLFGLTLFDIRTELARNARDFIEEREFPFVELPFFLGEAGYQKFQKRVEGWFDRIRLGLR